MPPFAPEKIVIDVDSKGVFGRYSVTCPGMDHFWVWSIRDVMFAGHFCRPFSSNSTLNPDVPTSRTTRYTSTRTGRGGDPHERRSYYNFGRDRIPETHASAS